MKKANEFTRVKNVGIEMNSMRPLRDLCALCVENVPNCFLQGAGRFGWSSLLCISLLADAGIGRERAVVVRLDTGLNVVPFAVPVATPVAVLQPGGVVYSYSPSNAEEDAKLRAEFEAFKRWRLTQNTQSLPAADARDGSAGRPAANAMPLVAANCIACHRGEQAKGGVRLDGLLSSDARLAAIRAVLSGEMPKGKTLAADDVGALLFELSDGAVSASSVKGE
jgi:mono/diheme cytochrome c family protein